MSLMLDMSCPVSAHSTMVICARTCDEPPQSFSVISRRKFHQPLRVSYHTRTRCARLMLMVASWRDECSKMGKLGFLAMDGR